MMYEPLAAIRKKKLKNRGSCERPCWWNEINSIFQSMHSIMKLIKVKESCISSHPIQNIQILSPKSMEHIHAISQNAKWMLIYFYARHNLHVSSNSIWFVSFLSSFHSCAHAYTHFECVIAATVAWCHRSIVTGCKEK